jgi:hypothetical protein
MVEIGLKVRGLRILAPRMSGVCLRFNRKYPSPDPPPTPSVRTMKG